MPSAVVIERASAPGAQHIAKFAEHVSPALTNNQALVKMDAVSLNHRDLLILKDISYRPIRFGAVLGSDGVGHISKLSGPSDRLKENDRVVVMPSIGWNNDPRGPEEESEYFLLGGNKPEGVFSEYYVGDLDNIFKAPEHLTDIEAAALPLAGLTAYRALFTKGQVSKGQNVLITGIGGGVALFSLQFALAVGANVYVTSSDDAKIEKAIQLGAKGGANYRRENWDQELLKATKGKQIDVVIDGASGSNAPIILTRVLHQGGYYVNYGVTAGPIEWNMSAIGRNVELRASTMGSRKEFEAMLQFVDQHKVQPIVSDVFKGLAKASDALEQLDKGAQFGKVVVTVKEN